MTVLSKCVRSNIAMSWIAHDMKHAIRDIQLYAGSSRQLFWNMLSKQERERERETEREREREIETA